MMPYYAYRIHHLERPKSPTEVYRADEQVARVASVVSALWHGFTRPVRVVRRLPRVAAPGQPRVA